LLLEERGEGSLEQPVGGGLSELLHESEVDVQTGPSGPEDPTGDDFTPIGGEGADFLEQFRREGAVWHSKSCLVLAEKAPE